MSLGKESDLVSSLYTRTSVSDFDRLCEVDVLGLEENHLIHDENVYKKIQTTAWEKWGVLVRDRSCVDREQSAFKQQQIWEPGTPVITFEMAWTKPRKHMIRQSEIS